MSSDVVTKEQKERLIDKKMEDMKRMNALLEQRHKEIEDDKKHAVQHSSNVQMQEVKTYVMKPTPPRPDRPKAPIRTDVGEDSAIPIIPFFSQRLGEDNVPPPDPSNKFLFDPDRDTKIDNVLESHGSDQREKFGGRGNDKGRYGAKNRGYKNTVTIDRDHFKDNSMVNIRSKYSPRSNYRGLGRRINYNWGGQNQAYGRGRGSSASSHDGWRQTDTHYAERKGMNRQQSEHDSWKYTQDDYDRQRIARSKQSDGQWRREWDSGKESKSLQSNSQKKGDCNDKESNYHKTEEADPFEQYLVNKDNRNVSHLRKVDSSPEAQPSVEEHNVKTQIDDQFARFLVNKPEDRIKLSEETEGCQELNVNNQSAFPINKINDLPDKNSDSINKEFIKVLHGKENSECETTFTLENRFTGLTESVNEIQLPSTTREAISENNYIHDVTQAVLKENITNSNLITDHFSFSINQEKTGDLCMTEDEIVDVSFTIELEDAPKLKEADTIEELIPLKLSITNDSAAAVAAPNSPISMSTLENTFPPSPRSMCEISSNDGNVSILCSTDITNSSECLSNVSSVGGDETVSFNLKDAVQSDQATSETSSIYEAVDEDFPLQTPSEIAQAAIDNSYLTPIYVPANSSSESAFHQNKESNYVSPESSNQIDSPDNSILQFTPLNESSGGC